MQRLTENKIVLVVRATRLGDLKARFATKMQAKFYVSRLGGDFADYEKEDTAYQAAIVEARQILSSLGRVQIVQRAMLPNFVFGPQDTIVALGQDGLVANTLKYLSGQPLIGVNPDPQRWDGKLLPFAVRDLDKIVREVLRQRRSIKQVTMAKVTLNTGPTLHAVNDFFIGARTHISARYRIQLGKQGENHSSSGVIVSTGLGSTGWLKSLLTGAAAITHTAGSVLGSTGHWPVPSRDSPDGIGVTAAANRRNALGPVPVRGSPTGAGGSPAPPIFKTGSQRFVEAQELLRDPVGSGTIPRNETP